MKVCQQARGRYASGGWLSIVTMAKSLEVSAKLESNRITFTTPESSQIPCQTSTYIFQSSLYLTLKN